MTETGMLSVFVSSTYKDLKAVRGLLIEKIEKSLRAVAMEKFTPVDKPSHEETLRNLEESDVCVFIIGDFYGSVIKECSRKECRECDKTISFTHCEYKRAVKDGKPHMTYIVENRLSEILSHVDKFDLESVSENDIREFLKRKGLDRSCAPFFSGYSLNEVEELWEVLSKSDSEKLTSLKGEIAKRELFKTVKVEKRDDYDSVYEAIMKDLEKNILRWYKEGLKFADFAGRRDELSEFLEKLDTWRSVCVVGTGGVGKTSLIQVGLLLERLQEKKIYAFLKDYTYQHTRAGYPHAREKFTETTFSRRLTLVEILNKVFQNDRRLDGILKFEESEQCSFLIEELNKEGSILFIDDLQDADENVKQLVYNSGNNLKKGAVVAGTRERGNCCSVVELAGLRGADLEEMIAGLARMHSVSVDVEALSGEIFRITQGHPMLVDIMVKNASHFADFEKLRKMEGIRSIADQKTVNEVMDRLIRAILTEDESKVIGMLSVFPLPVDREFVDMIGGEKAVEGIIDKGLLRWKGKLVFTFDAVRELLEAEAPVEYHEKAVEYYGRGLEKLPEPEKTERYVEIVYHLLRVGKDEEAFCRYFKVSRELERARGRAVGISEMILAKTSEESRRAYIRVILGNLLLKGREFAKARECYDEALRVYRELAEKDPGAYEPDVAMTLNNLGALYSDLRDFKKAEESYTEALKIRRELAEKDPGAYEPDVAMTLNNLGNLYNNLRDFKKAEESYTEALTHKDSLPDDGARIYLGLATLAEKTKNEDAHKIYFMAGILSCNLLIIYGLPSIDFLHCFKKTQELSPPDSPLQRMAAIAIASISNLKTPQPTDDLNSLKTDDLPDICKALITLLTKKETTSVKTPENNVELMFFLLYQEIAKSQENSKAH